jgi:hypothetical protein
VAIVNRQVGVYLAVPPRGDAHLSGKTVYIAKWRQIGAKLAMVPKIPNILTDHQSNFYRQAAPNSAKWRQIGGAWRLSPF